jgi:hypothetical protein
MDNVAQSYKKSRMSFQLRECFLNVLVGGLVFSRKTKYIE